ncbi:MAG: group II intron maturase-specific domain-containing protein [Gammaproteobacteria bacterium]
MRLHPDKTHCGNCREAGYGFEFLGYRFEGGHRYVRPKSLKALRDRVRQRTGRTRSGSLEQIMAELNPILQGWFAYFKHARGSTFRSIDSFVRRRLRAILRKRLKQPGFGLSHRDHLRCPWASHLARGLCAGAPIPMRKPPTGEPCAGKPLARFGGRGDASLPDPYRAPPKREIPSAADFFTSARSVMTWTP